ncbi:MAG: prepilin peptidase [Clostridiales Family XIII bacterium]|nr:prepilin peptidase [Clostridiales Family XIII bacterium]
MYIIIYAIIFIVGAVIGSFLNVLIFRLPRKINFVHGFSYCPTCEHRLYPKDLVPIASYLFLGRKCRYCKEPISPRYMIVEISGGLLAVLSGLAYLPPTAFASGSPYMAIIVFAAFSVLLTIAVIDADTMEIPDSLNIAILVCGIAAIWLAPDVSIVTRIIGLFAVSVPLFIIALFVGGAFGMGDIKLMAAAGFLLGWKCALVALFVGIIIGGVQGVLLLARRKKGRKDHFAFGPALCVGIAVGLLAGERLIGWYLAFF